jgi:hypothetical protein
VSKVTCLYKLAHCDLFSIFYDVLNMMMFYEGLDGGVPKSVIDKIMGSKSATDMKKAKSIKTTFGWMGFPKSVIDKIVGNKPINNTNFAKSL